LSVVTKRHIPVSTEEPSELFESTNFVFIY